MDTNALDEPRLRRLIAVGRSLMEELDPEALLDEILDLTEKQHGPFDAADEEALVVLADWAAVAVENARLNAELQVRHDEAARANHVLAATTAIVRAIGTETDLERVLELIVTRGRALVSARTMLISLPKGSELEVAAIAGERDDAHPGMGVPIAGSTAGEVLREGRPRRQVVDDLGVSPAQLGVDGADSSLLVPLVFRGRSLGVLLALDPLDGSPVFSAEDEELLLAFAASAATAVATAQSIGEERLSDALASAEQERRRWARELHDETLQGLAGLHVRLAIAEQRSQDDDTTAAVHDVLDAMGTEIRKLRSLITELRPAALDEVGLAPALESLTRGVAAGCGLEIDAHVDLQEQRLDPELETTIFRLVQESLTNVVKHAEATRCTITVIRADGQVDVTVSDDGRGLDDTAVGRRKGFGLTGMRERAHLAGGVLELQAGPDGGTELRARLPAVAAPPTRPAAHDPPL